MLGISEAIFVQHHHQDTTLADVLDLTMCLLVDQPTIAVASGTAIPPPQTTATIIATPVSAPRRLSAFPLHITVADIDLRAF
jgi:hypothetical protein